MAACHVHAHYQQVEFGSVYLANGVTTVRDVGNEILKRTHATRGSSPNSAQASSSSSDHSEVSAFSISDAATAR